MSQGEVLSLLSGILGLAGRYNDEQIELTKAYIHSAFKGTQQSHLLAILENISALRHDGTQLPLVLVQREPSAKLHSEQPTKTKSSLPNGRRLLVPSGSKRRLPATVPDSQTMEREIVDMLADPTFVEVLGRAESPARVGNVIVEYMMVVFKRQGLIPLYSRSRGPLSRSEALQQARDAFLQLASPDQARVYKAVLRDFLSHRGSNLGALTKLINEEGDE